MGGRVRGTMATPLSLSFSFALSFFLSHSFDYVQHDDAQRARRETRETLRMIDEILRRCGHTAALPPPSIPAAAKSGTRVRERPIRLAHNRRTTTIPSIPLHMFLDHRRATERPRTSRLLLGRTHVARTRRRFVRFLTDGASNDHL